MTRNAKCQELFPLDNDCFLSYVKNMGKRGRPKLSKAEAKRVLVSVRVKPAERDAYEVAARGNKVAFSEWVRTALNAAANGAAHGEEAKPQASGPKPNPASAMPDFRRPGQSPSSRRQFGNQC